jgi:hypothetical protein
LFYSEEQVEKQGLVVQYGSRVVEEQKRVEVQVEVEVEAL